MAVEGLPGPLREADFHRFDPQKARIGQLLFYDKLLSGNQNISCGTCHHHDHAGTDALSLGIGEGGEGVGPDRTPGHGDSRIIKRIPRNAPALWNLGHKSLHTVFHDGRLFVSDKFGNGFKSPAAGWLPDGLETIIAAQALFPMTARFEMAGDPHENAVGRAAQQRIDWVWPILARRVQTNPGYATMFVGAFDHIDRSDQISIVDIANALAAFIGSEWQNFDSPFDAYLAGDAQALSEPAMRGMDLFYGEANCAACHSGPLLTDQAFHALALPAFGPGRTRRFDPIA